MFNKEEYLEELLDYQNRLEQNIEQIEKGEEILSDFVNEKEALLDECFKLVDKYGIEKLSLSDAQNAGYSGNEAVNFAKYMQEEWELVSTLSNIKTLDIVNSYNISTNDEVKERIMTELEIVEDEIKEVKNLTEDEWRDREDIKFYDFRVIDMKTEIEEREDYENENNTNRNSYTHIGFLLSDMENAIKSLEQFNVVETPEYDVGISKDGTFGYFEDNVNEIEGQIIIEDNAVVDYDGCYELPEQVVNILKNDFKLDTRAVDNSVINEIKNEVENTNKQDNTEAKVNKRTNRQGA